MSPRIFLLSVFLLSGCGNGNTVGDAIQSADQAVAAKSYDDAIEAAQRGLSAKPEPKDRWRLEFLQIEALARKGDSAAVLSKLEELAQVDGSPIKGSHYVSTGDQLKGAGQAAGAVELLDKGADRFPKDPDIKKAFEQLMESGDEGELEALKTLGYL